MQCDQAICNMEIKIFNNKTVNKSFRERSGGVSTFQSLESIQNLFNNQSKAEQNDFVLLEMFNTVPEFAAPIKYSANLAARVPYKIVEYDNKGNEIRLNIPEVSNLLDNPNPFQSAINFKRTSYINYQLFGNNYTNIYKGIGSLKLANWLFILPTQYVSIIFEKMQCDKINPDADFRTNEIISYTLKYANSNIPTIPKEEISHFKDSQMNFDNGTYAKGQSRGYSAIMATKTIKAGYEAKYSYYINRGALGMFINNDPDGVRLDPKEKRRVLDAFKTTYGLKEGQDLFQFINHNMTYQNIAPDFSGLQINENNEADFRAICKALGGFPPSLLMDNRVALLRDGNQKKKELYEAIIIPMVNDWHQKKSVDLGLTKKGVWIIADYSKIEALQEDLVKKGSINKSYSEGISKVLNDFNSNQLSYVQALYLLTTKWNIEEDESKKLLVKPEKPDNNEA